MAQDARVTSGAHPIRDQLGLTTTCVVMGRGARNECQGIWFLMSFLTLALSEAAESLGAGFWFWFRNNIYIYIGRYIIYIYEYIIYI